MNRNKMIDFIRGIAILIIVYYHIYAITMVSFKYEIINSVSSILGKIGVSIFFLISGYGIYTSIKNKGDKFKYKEYIKSRFKRIAPQYYFCIFVCLLFTSSGSRYITKEGVPAIFTHFIFVHNLFLNHHGAINGALWTMGTIFQFYLIAPLLYYIIEKKPKIATILSVLFTLLMKYFVLGILIPKYAPIEQIDSYFSIYGRQLILVIDNFLLGMLLAKMLYNYNFQSETKFHNIIFGIISFFAVVVVVILIGSNFYNIPYFSGPLYAASIKGYTWNTIFCIVLTIFIYFLSKIKIEQFIYKPMEIITKNEYGIYLWHLPILYNLIENSSYIKNMIINNDIAIYVVLSAITVVFGICINKLFER